MSVFGVGRISTHVDPTCGLCTRLCHLRRGFPVQATQPICPILGFWGSKVAQNGRFPAQDADESPSFIVGGEIGNRTNTQKTNKQKNSN